jgi:hypothetical protein
LKITIGIGRYGEIRTTYMIENPTFGDEDGSGKNNNHQTTDILLQGSQIVAAS